jgi:hypothetical protein
MYNPFLADTYTKAHHTERLKEAEKDRLLKAAMAGRPKLQERLLLSISDLLITFGLWLKARYQPNSAAPTL